MHNNMQWLDILLNPISGTEIALFFQYGVEADRFALQWQYGTGWRLVCRTALPGAPCMATFSITWLVAW
jgi:hypothetical protein